MATQAQKDRATDLRLRRTYGITLNDYNKMLKKQKGGCAICGRPPKRLRLSVDHNHLSGKVRGLLCFICNKKVIGIIERFKIRPSKIILYLKTYDSNNNLIKGQNA